MKYVIKLLFLALVCVTKIAGNKTGLLQSFNFNLILEGLKNINSTSVCGFHIKEYVAGLTSEKLWARTMYDSSAHTLHGVYLGNNKFIGHYDECLSVKHPEGLFDGQHCVLNVDLFDEENGLDIFHLNRFKFFSRSNYFSTLFAICIPSTCHSKEIKVALEDWFNKTEGTGSIYLELNDYNCYTEKGVASKKTNRFFIYCLISIGILNLCSTIYDIGQRLYCKSDQPQKLLSAFSIYTNSLHLFRDIQGNLKSLDGLRGFTSILTLYTHISLWSFQGPVENMRDMQKEIEEYGFINLTFVVDTFFFMSGFLVTHLFYREIAKVGYYDFPLSVINRYLRLTPLLVLMRCFYGWLFLNLGSGPLWNQINKETSESCQENWTSTFLYTWNYVDPMQKCMMYSWSSNIDMQLYWLSPLILIPILYYPAWALFYLTSLVSIAIYISFHVNYSHGFQPHMKHAFARWAPEYIVTHTRASTWLVGLFFGCLLHKIRENKIKFSKFQKWTGWAVSLISILVSLLGNYFLKDDASDFQGALCISLQKIIWVLGWSWVILACEEGFGGPINAFFSWRILQLLGKLSYSIYLIHHPILSYFMGVKTTNYTTGLFKSANLFLTVSVLTIIIAIPMTILVEVPATNISKYILRNVKIFPLYKPAENGFKFKEKEKKLK